MRALWIVDSFLLLLYSGCKVCIVTWLINSPVGGRAKVSVHQLAIHVLCLLRFCRSQGVLDVYLPPIHD